MPSPIARISILNNRVYRGLFKDAPTLRLQTVFADGDYAQAYQLKRLYRFDAASAVVDDGVLVIRPNSIVPANPGRWLSTTTIQLSAALSVPSVPSATISSYAWVLVTEPSLGILPTATVIPAGANATLSIPTVADWKSGGILVFLRVMDTNGEESINNPFSPYLNEDANFRFVLATELMGLEVPPAGVRNWHFEWLRTARKIDSEVAAALLAIPFSYPTTADKAKLPTGVTAGNDSIVPDSTEASGFMEIEFTPTGNSYVRATVNGAGYEVGDNDITKDCYFVDPGLGAPAGVRPIANIQAGDQFVWNGVVTGFNLSVTDKIDFEYNV